MSVSIKFSLLLYILSGFHRHVCPSQNKTFIFNNINLLFLKFPNRHLFDYLFLDFYF